MDSVDLGTPGCVTTAEGARYFIYRTKGGWDRLNGRARTSAEILAKQPRRVQVMNHPSPLRAGHEQTDAGYLMKMIRDRDDPKVVQVRRDGHPPP